jgi:predicted phage terminase large subunit-like protein
MINNLFNKILNTDFKCFLHKSFNTLHPNQEFENNWHIDMIIEYLSAIKNRHINRLVINLPPRSLKSLLLNVIWPAWLLGHNPAIKIISVSYNKQLANKHAQDCRNIIQSDWYKMIFPNTEIIDNNKLLTTQHGFRFNTSINATLTGEGADLIILDDPISAAEALSHNKREKLYTWFNNSLVSRLNHKDGTILLVMQRLHPEDLTSQLLKTRQWHHIKIPAIAEEDENIHFNNFHYYRNKGEALYSRQNFEEIKKTVGNNIFSSQYQQNPIITTENYFQLDWIKFYDNKHFNKFDNIYLSWDCAVKSGIQHDYTVGTVWGRIDNKYYLIDVIRKKCDYPNLRNLVISQYDKYKPCIILIEDKSSGQQLIQELRQFYQYIKIEVIKPIKNKIERFIMVHHLFERGIVLFPTNATWLNDIINEIVAFPHSNHDDQVDSISQMLNWFQKNFSTPVFRSL